MKASIEVYRLQSIPGRTPSWGCVAKVTGCRGITTLRAGFVAIRGPRVTGWEENPRYRRDNLHSSVLLDVLRTVTMQDDASDPYEVLAGVPELGVLLRMNEMKAQLGSIGDHPDALALYVAAQRMTGSIQDILDNSFIWESYPAEARKYLKTTIISVDEFVTITDESWKSLGVDRTETEILRLLQVESDAKAAVRAEAELAEYLNNNLKEGFGS